MKSIIKLIQKFNRQICHLFRNDTFSFAFTVLFVASLLLVLPRTYGVNDNVGILFDAEGGFISEFTSFFYMKLLHLLYQMTNDIPWYGLALYFAHILSLFIFVRSLARIKNFDAFFIPFLIVYLYFYSFFIVQVDYSSTSIMVGANSLFAFLVLLSNRRKVSIFSVLGLGFLFSLSFLIRIPGTYAVLVYGFPIIGLFLIGKYPKKMYLIYFVIFLMPFLLFLIGDNLARTHLTSIEYQQYHEFNSLRGKLHDYPILGINMNNPKILKENNWTKNDYESFVYWNFFDERKYNVTTLNNILKYSVLEKEHKIQKYFSSYFQTSIKLIYYSGNKWHFYLLLLTGILVIFRFHLGTLSVVFCYLLYAISVSVYLDIFYRFPTRIGHPILLMCTIFLIFLIFKFFSGKFSKKNTYYNLLVAIFSFGILGFLFSTGMRHNLTTDVLFKSSFNRLQSAYQGKILYIPPLALQWEKMDPLKRYHFNFHQIVYAGGTSTFSPGFYNELEKLGVKKGYELIPDLVNNPNAYVIAMSKNQFCSTSDYNLKCKAVVIEQLPNGHLILKLKSKGVIESAWFLIIPYATLVFKYLLFH
ncbi:MAG: hypothetical protein VSS75_021180 [Candidatus Parabeggiatoa sp.]|nr:hypothetical protein [Candidatus Parabeggiatoa sp.]